MKKIRSSAIYKITALFGRIYSVYIGLTEYHTSKFELNKYLDINKEQFKAFCSNPLKYDLPFGTREELAKSLDLLFTESEPQGFQVFEPKIDNTTDFSDFFYERLFLKPTTFYLHKSWLNSDEREKKKSLEIMKKIVLEFVFYANIKKLNLAGFNKVSLENAIDLSISTEFFLHNVSMSVFLSSFSEDFNFQKFHNAIFTSRLLRFLNSFNNFKIPNWNFYSKRIIKSMKTAKENITKIKTLGIDPKDRAIGLYMLNLNLYSFLNNILFHLVDHLNYNEFFGTFNFRFRDKQFIKIINNGLEDNTFNAVCFYHEKDALSVFENNKSSDESFKPIKKLPSIQELRNMSHSDLKKLQTQLARSVKEVESNIEKYKEETIKKATDISYKPEFDAYYKRLEKKYNDDIKILEDWSIQSETNKNDDKETLLTYSGEKLVSGYRFYIHLWNEVFLKTYKEKVSLLQSEIVILFGPVVASYEKAADIK